MTKLITTCLALLTNVALAATSPPNTKPETNTGPSPRCYARAEQAALALDNINTRRSMAGKHLSFEDLKSTSNGVDVYRMVVDHDRTPLQSIYVIEARQSDCIITSIVLVRST